MLQYNNTTVFCFVLADQMRSMSLVVIGVKVVVDILVKLFLLLLLYLKCWRFMYLFLSEVFYGILHFRKIYGFLQVKRYRYRKLYRLPK